MFAIRNLSVLAYANGFTLWHYKAGNDSLFDVGRVGYFNDAADMFATGDMILVSGAEGATVYVTAVDGRRVTTASLSNVRVPELV